MDDDDAPVKLPPPEEDVAAEPKRRCGRLRSCGSKVLEILDMTSVQSVQYIMFLFVFQSLVFTFRDGNERYFTKFIEDTWTDNTFDSAHNTFNDIRRISDIYEWMNTVMVPGLFSNADYGEGWPDGDGSFALEGHTPYSTSELVSHMNAFGLDAVVVKQVRGEDTEECYAGHACLDGVLAAGNTTPFGYAGASQLAPGAWFLGEGLGLDSGGAAAEAEVGAAGAGGAGDAEGFEASEGSEGSGGGDATDEAGSGPDGGGQAAALPSFRWSSAEALGASGVLYTAHTNSLRIFETGGYTAIFIPFFSTDYLPYERGPFTNVTDFRATRATVRNGKAPTYYCARYTLDGVEVVQACNRDPARNDALVRELLTQMLTELKHGHYLDMRSRVLSLHLQMRNNHADMLFTVRYMFELTKMKGLLPSFDIETMLTGEAVLTEMKMWLALALAMTGWFCMLEMVELSQAGFGSYFSNMWNVLDWANFSLFLWAFMSWADMILIHEADLAREDAEALGPPYACGSPVCDDFGYFDPHAKMSAAKSAKMFTAFCICIQLLKIIKFTNVLVPKMSLMTRVLSKGAYDLAFFGIIFGISIFAFTMLLFIQLGSFMDDFNSQFVAFTSLVRALFGDFDFDEIMDNSRGYTNGILFLIYLFVAVFILLSMFLAILGEAQAYARDDESQARERGEFSDYGSLGELAGWLKRKWALLRNRKGGGDDEDGGGGGGDEEEEEDADIVALRVGLLKVQSQLEDRIKARVGSMESTVLKRLARLEAAAVARKRRAAQSPGARASPNGGRGLRAGRSAAASGASLGCSTDSGNRRGPSPAVGGRPQSTPAARPGLQRGGSSGALSADAKQRSRSPNEKDRSRERAGKSHPGRSYEREWSKARGAAAAVETHSAASKRRSKDGKADNKDREKSAKGHSPVDDALAC